MTRLLARALLTLFFARSGSATSCQAEQSRDEPRRAKPYHATPPLTPRRCSLPQVRARARLTRPSLFFHAVSAGLSSAQSPVVIYPSPFLTPYYFFSPSPTRYRPRPFGPLCGTSALLRRNPPSSLSSLRHFARRISPPIQRKFVFGMYAHVCIGTVAYRTTIYLSTGSFQKWNVTRGTERYFNGETKSVRPGL